MAKIKNAIFGLSASGSISKAITFVRRNRQQIVEKKPELKDAETGPQLSWRHMFLKVVALWHALSPAEQAEWESAARPKHMTGYAWFVSQALRPNPGIYLPLQGGKMSGEIDMDGNRIEDLPDPTLPQDAATKEYVDLALASMVWNYFLNDTASGIGSYFTMSQTATGDVESDFTTAGLGGGDAQALTDWITDEAVPYLVIRKGQLDFHIHAEKTVGNRSVIIYAELYEYKTDTSEVLIATTEDSGAITDKVSVSVHATLPDDYTLATGSKLLVKYLADLGAGAPTTIVLSAEGSTAAGIDVSVLSSAFDDVYIRNSILVAQSILAAVSDATPLAVEIAEQRLVGRITDGNITGLTIAQILTLIGVAAGADVTGNNPPKAHEGTHVSGGSDAIDSALANAAIPNLATSKITSGQFPLVRMPRGTNTHVLTAKGAGVSPAYEAPAAGNGGIWTLAEELSPASVTSILSSTLAAHDLWMVIVGIGSDTGAAGNWDADLRFNEDDVVVYTTIYLNNLTVTKETGHSHLKLGTGYRHTSLVYPFTCQFIVNGKGASKGVMGSSASSYTPGSNSFLNAIWFRADDIVSFQFLFGVAATGEIKIYYMDY